MNENISPVEAVEATRKDAQEEDDRVFLAYCQRHKLRINSLSNKEFYEHYARALANRHLYPIPLSDPQYLYHGTAKANIAKVAQNGLFPSILPNTKRFNLVKHSLGRVFFADTISSAFFYAIRAVGRKKQKVIMRVLRDNLPDAQEDIMDSNCVFIERTIPSEEIEVWNGSMWSKLPLCPAINSTPNNQQLPSETMKNEIKLSDLYSKDELYDESEILGFLGSEFGSMYWEKAIEFSLQVKTMTSEEAELSLISWKHNDSLIDVFEERATKSQKKFVHNRMNDFDHDRIIVLNGYKVVDGNHHAVAAIKAGKPVHYVNLEDLPTDFPKNQNIEDDPTP